MKLHKDLPEVKTLVNANIAVLLTGEAGSGKTTLGNHVAKELDLEFSQCYLTARWYDLKLGS